MRVKSYMHEWNMKWMNLIRWQWMHQTKDKNRRDQKSKKSCINTPNRNLWDSTSKEDGRLRHLGTMIQISQFTIFVKISSALIKFSLISTISWRTLLKSDSPPHMAPLIKLSYGSLWELIKLGVGGRTFSYTSYHVCTVRISWLAPFKFNQFNFFSQH